AAFQGARAIDRSGARRASQMSSRIFTALLLAASTSISFAPAQASASSRFASLVAAARERTLEPEVYDPSYQVIGYPMGAVREDRGVCTDVVIRAYRGIGIDLQVLVHEDMAAHFAEYPKLWNLTHPDTNIDHRRVPNLQRFFERAGAKVGVSQR